MTNFEPIKEKIWAAAQKQNKKKFDKECDNLMKKTLSDWWRIGWSICPKDIDDFQKMLEKLAKSAHKEWLKAMKHGDAPPEDVSPGEGFIYCATLIKDLKKKAKEASKAKVK